MIVRGMAMILDTNHHGKISQEEGEGIQQEEEAMAEAVITMVVQGGIVLILPPSIPMVPTKWEALAVRRGERRRTSPTILVNGNIIITKMIPHSSPITNITTKVMIVYLLRTLVLVARVLMLPIAAGRIVVMLLIHEA